MTMPAKQVLEKALNLIGGDRAADYGAMWENHENIAQLWNGYLYNKESPLTAEDVANLMELMKIARRKLGALKKDNYVDGAGYAAVAFECAKEQYDRNTVSDQLPLELLAKKYNEDRT